jgi:WD40 repeat protein
MQDVKREPRPIDPILNLPLASSATSLCFVNNQATTISNDDDSSDDSSDTSEELDFRSSRLQRQKLSQPSSKILSNRFLVSCHLDGEALLWDLGRQTNIATVSLNRGGPGLAVKRMDSTRQILYQTRDPRGTVSIHSMDGGSGCSLIRNYETYSETFCQAAPCVGDSHLLALPSRQDSTVTVMDERASAPVVTIPIQKHGMLTSLAMSVSGGGGGTRPILACGMESGSVIFHDFSAGASSTKAEYKLTNDPILTMDLISSDNVGSDDKNLSSVLALAGMAGDAAEVSELQESEKGRVALLKATTDPGSPTQWNFRLRARLATCRTDDQSYGKPGVSNCRFRPRDGRLFAVGGWDNRVRLFERSKGKAMAILRGHTGSVNALDWAPDAMTSGLLASAGGDDNRVYLWHCFAKD